MAQSDFFITCKYPKIHELSRVDIEILFDNGLTIHRSEVNFVHRTLNGRFDIPIYPPRDNDQTPVLLLRKKLEDNTIDDEFFRIVRKCNNMTVSYNIARFGSIEHLAALMEMNYRFIPNVMLRTSFEYGKAMFYYLLEYSSIMSVTNIEYLHEIRMLNYTRSINQLLDRKLNEIPINELRINGYEVIGNEPTQITPDNPQLTVLTKVIDVDELRGFSQNTRHIDVLSDDDFIRPMQNTRGFTSNVRHIDVLSENDFIRPMHTTIGNRLPLVHLTRETGAGGGAASSVENQERAMANQRVLTGRSPPKSQNNVRLESLPQQINRTRTPPKRVPQSLHGARETIRVGGLTLRNGTYSIVHNNKHYQIAEFIEKFPTFKIRYGSSYISHQDALDME